MSKQYIIHYRILGSYVQDFASGRTLACLQTEETFVHTRIQTLILQ
jgi:hypothetical protein